MVGADRASSLQCTALIFPGRPMNLQIACAVTMLGFLAAPSFAGTYPVSGKWTYENASAAGAARECGSTYMEFRGVQRFDTGGGVPRYRNVAVSGSSPSWLVVDEFLAVQIRGRVTYTLRIVDGDHIELRIDEAGKRILLRRCSP